MNEQKTSPEEHSKRMRRLLGGRSDVTFGDVMHYVRDEDPDVGYREILRLHGAPDDLAEVERKIRESRTTK